MGSVHNQYLPEIAGISKHFLVAGHTSIETYLTGGGSDSAKSLAMVYSTIS